MNQETKNILKNSLFFLDGVDSAVADSFLDALPDGEEYSKGEIVCTPEMEGRGLGILVCGSLEIRAGHNPVSIRRMDAPDVFGAASLFGGEGYVSTLCAVNNVKVVFITQDLFSDLMRQDFRVAQNYIRFLSEKVRFLNCKIENFTAGCSSAALLDHLSRLADGEGILPAPDNMSRLAKMLNMGRTSLYRAVEELEKSGRLTRNGDSWKISK